MNNLLASPNPFDFKEIFSNFLTQWYFYVVLAFIFLVVVIFSLFYKHQKRVQLDKTHRITTTAFLTAMCIVVNMFDVGNGIYKISLVGSACFIAGYLLGAGTGFTVAFLGDLIGNIIFPRGVYNPIIAIASACWGFIPGLVFHNFKGNKYVLCVISFLVCFFVCSISLNTIGTYFMYLTSSTKYTSVGAYLLARILPISIGIVLNTSISILLLPELEHLKSHIGSSS